MSKILYLAIAGLISVVAVDWIFLKILKIAKVKGLVDNPDARKLQKDPVPVLGGIAVYFGVLFGLMVFGSLYGLQGILPVMVGSSIMLYVGALDDIMGLTPKSRIVIETLVLLGIILGSGMCIDSLHGLWGIEELSWWVAVPLTVFAGVGIINAYNMVDGVNGLSSGLCMACSCILGVIFYKRGDMSNAALAFCFAGALVPFYVHNVFGAKSKMFIGDAGTMVMGLLVTWFVIRVLSSKNVAMAYASDRNNHMCLVAMMVAIASVPVFDTLRVMTGRILRGVSPFTADKTHLHHIFIATGVSHLVTSLGELLLNMMVIGIWYLCYLGGVSLEVQLYVTIGAAMVLVWGTYIYLHYQSVHKTKMFVRFNRWSRVTHWGGKQWWLGLQKRLDKGAFTE